MKKLSTKGTQRIMAILCVFCMMFMLCVETSVVYAQGKATITASSGTAEKGKTVAVSFQLSGNPGIWGMKFKVGYNHDVLTLKSAEVGNIFSKSEVSIPENLNKEKFVFYAEGKELENNSKNGTLITINVRKAHCFRGGMDSTRMNFCI